MQSDEHNFDGSGMIPAAEAARSSGLNRDYVARLARTGKISGEQRGGDWYVSLESLHDFSHRQKRLQEERRVQLMQERKNEYHRACVAPESFFEARSPHAAVEHFDTHKKLAAAVLKKMPTSTIHAAPAYAVAPMMDFMHRATALVTAVTLIFGTYAFADWSRVQPMLADAAASAKYAVAHADVVAERTAHAAHPSQLAAVAFSLPDSLASLAKALNENIDHLLFGVIFGNVALRPSDLGAVNVVVAPGTEVRVASGLPQATSTQPQPTVSQRSSDRAPERVIYTERVVTAAGVTKAYVDQGLLVLRQEFLNRMSSMENANSTSFVSVAETAGGSSLDTTSVAITGGTISGVTITGGSVTATAFSGTLSETNGGTGLATYAAGDLIYADAADSLARLAVGSTGQVLKVVGGVPTWSTDLQGSGGAGAWATSTDDLLISPSDTTDVVAIGTNATSTTGNILEVLGSSLFRGSIVTYNNLTAPRFTATSSVASVFPYASTTAITASYASSTLYYGAGLANCASGNMLTWTNGQFGCEDDSTGGGGASFGQGWEIFSGAYLAPTTTLGILVAASSTIGNGTQAGGLTISGGATTTGNLVVQGTGTSTFAGGLQSTALNITSTSASSTFANGINLSAGCFAVNGVCITGGGSSASSTLLSDVNTFSGNTTFAASVTANGNLLVSGALRLLDEFWYIQEGGSYNLAGNDHGVRFAANGASAGRTWTFYDTSGNVARAAINIADGSSYFQGNMGIGTTSPYAKLSVVGETVASHFTATTTATSTLPVLAVGTSLNLFGTYGNSLDDFCTAITGGSGLCDGVDATGSGGSGLATSTDIADTYVIYGTSASDVGAESAFTYDDATDRLTVINASTTNISASYASSTQGFFGSLSVGSLSGILKATAGAVATALVDLAADVTGILPVANGGTGWGNVQAGGILYGNGTGALATTTQGTGGQVLAWLNGAPTWTATSTLSTITGTLAVGKGGTGQTTFTAGQLLYGNGTDALSSVATSSLAVGSSLSVSGTLGAQIGGANATISLNTANANTWSALQQFNAHASSTQFSSLDGIYIGRTSTTTIIGSATSTFGAGVQTTYLNVTGTAATSTFANGISLSGGCFRDASGNCLANSSITTLDSLTDVDTSGVAYGGLIQYDGASWIDVATSTLGIALSDTTGTLAVNRGGTGATTLDNLITLGDHTTGNYLATLSSSGSLTIGNSGSETAAVTANLNMGNANSWTALQSFLNASSTLFSNVGTSYFGGTATTTIDSAGNVAVAGTLNVTGQTTLATSLTGLLKATSGVVSTATAGVDYVSGGRDWNVAFGALTPTTTLGVLVSASSTIGSGTQIGGLTISGGATTTGNSLVSGSFALTGNLVFAGDTIDELVGDGLDISSGDLIFDCSDVAGTGITCSGEDITATLGISIAANEMASADFGDWTCNGTTCALDADTVSDAEIDYSTVTLADFTNDGSYVTGSGSGNRIAYWSSASAVTSNANFTFDGTTLTAPDALISTSGTARLSINDSDSSGTDFRIDVDGGATTFNADVGVALTGEYFAFATNASEKLRITEAGRLGIGTSTPNAKVEIVDSSAASTTPLILTNFRSATSSASVNIEFRTATSGPDVLVGTTTAKIGSTILQNYNAGKGALMFSVLNSGLLTEAGRFDWNGYLGLGSTTPGRKLSVTEAVSTAQQSIAYDSTRATDLLTDSAGDFNINPSGDDVRLNDDNLWICTGGSCPTGTLAGTGNAIVETRLGVSTSTPVFPLSAFSSSESQLALSNGAGIAQWAFRNAGGNLYVSTTTVAGTATTTLPAITVIGSTGFTGIGTTSPTQMFSVKDRLYVGANGATGMGTATSTFQGDIKIIGKLDVATIDPPYTIDGVKYATYVASMTGVKEETAATVRLKENADGKYEAVINFDEVEKGSDLWLFYQATTFGEEWKELTVLLTPSFDGRVFYTKDVEGNRLVISGTEEGEVSMRLTAARYDDAKWPNIRPDQDGDTAGTHVLSSKLPGGIRHAAAAIEAWLR
jgi:hypothetical protein